MSSSSVRDALPGSVANSPVSLNSSHASTVPNTARPSRALPASPSTLRSSHSIFVAEKYGSSIRPVFARIASSSPASRSSPQRAAVRRSCQTSARCSGSPVDGSQQTTVSRWFVMPTASSSPGSRPASSSASPATACETSQISSASCSTQPGRGKCCVNSR